MRKYGRPNLFITVTCNPEWKEIQDELLHNQKVSDRPELIARILKLKLQAIEEDLYKGGIFGSSVAQMRVIEFQKRYV